MSARQEWLNTVDSMFEIEKNRAIELALAAVQDAMRTYGMLRSTADNILAGARANLVLLDAEDELPDEAMASIAAPSVPKEPLMLTSGCKQR